MRRPVPVLLVLPVLLAALALAGCTDDEPTVGLTPGLQASASAAPTAPAGTSAGAPAGWRTEWFRTVAVDVPDDWGWSQSPIDGPSRLFRCTDDRGLEPYVGRPVFGSDVCLANDPAPPPEHPYLWFDAPLDAGSEDLGDGWVRETIVLDGVRLSVASDDPDLRAAVLGSARPQDDCPPDLSERLPGRFDTTTEGPGTLLTAIVCAYRVLDQDRDAVPVLAYATVADEADVRAVWQRRERLQDCLVEPTLTSEVVVLATTTRDDFGAADAAPLVQRIVALVACEQAQRVVDPVVDAGIEETLATYLGPMG